jgi:hypothetical protein
VCEGSGAELVLTPDGSIGLRPCFWCDGTGEIEHDADAADCPACGRPMVPVTPDEQVCPDCSAWEPAADLLGFSGDLP